MPIVIINELGQDDPTEPVKPIFFTVKSFLKPNIAKLKCVSLGARDDSKPLDWLRQSKPSKAWVYVVMSTPNGKKEDKLTKLQTIFE